MASEHASRLKRKWMHMSEECFETLTFGELEVHETFIVLPSPGDNDGHGGLRTTHYLFQKTQAVVTHTATNVPYDLPHGGARELRLDRSNDFPHSMPVLRIV